MPYIQLMRPGQWTKNLFLFAGVVFGHKLIVEGQVQWDNVSAVLLAFACFCLVSSAVYVFNDVHDRNEDRLHPRKASRPLASGRVPVGNAVALLLALLIVGLGGAWWLDVGLFVVALVYLGLQGLYTLWFKHVALLDVIMIGLGFVLRAVAGAVVVHVEISHWLVLCTFTLCLFMGFSKRRCELNELAAREEGHAVRHRRTLALYTPELLNHMTTLTAGIAVVTFMLYATDLRTREVFGNIYLVYTLPIVVFAIFRFTLLVEHGRVSGPTDVVLRDRPFQAALLLWGAMVLVIIYGGADLRAWVHGILGRAS